MEILCSQLTTLTYRYVFFSLELLWNDRPAVNYNDEVKWKIINCLFKLRKMLSAALYIYVCI